MRTRERLLGLVRLVHPFPSLLTASATAAIAALAGAPAHTAGRLGLAMLAVQYSIGALNDLVDAPLDARQKPRKPIPSGLISPRTAAMVAIGAAALGILLSAASGTTTTIVALGGLGLGYAYDLRLSRTALSWLPLSLALPLLPIFAWVGAVGAVPSGLLALVPVGVLGGAGLALANGLVDIDRDRSVDRRAIAVRQRLPDVPAPHVGRRERQAAEAQIDAAIAMAANATSPNEILYAPLDQPEGVYHG